jgi:release factor glutamine methyltransferase
MLNTSESSADEQLGEAVVAATAVLQAAGCESPRLDAELLLAHSLGISRTQLHMRWRENLLPAVSVVFQGYIQRRKLREPVAYILHQRAFYDLLLEVNPATLVPRPESELLVEEAIRWCQRQPKRELWAADIGTGSGALAIALAKHVPSLQICAIDKSEAALEVAQRNILRYGLQERIHLSAGDLFEGVQRQVDVIVANLPYIPSTRLIELAPEVIQYEPLQALDGGDSGLEVIDRFCQQVPEHLGRPGLLLIEIDDGQGESVSSMLTGRLSLAHIQVLQDYAGLQRYVRAEVA